MEKGMAPKEIILSHVSMVKRNAMAIKLINALKLF
jgi:hypothetical protein